MSLASGRERLSVSYLSVWFRGHIDPVKNGDAFETLGIMTTLADRKDTVKCCDILSYGDDREMT